MNKKRIIALLVGLTLIVSLMAACGNSSSQSTTSTETPPATQPSTSTDQPAAQAPEGINWPTKEVKVLIPQDVGSPADIAARITFGFLEEYTGVKFVPENDGTGSGARVGELLYHADPDGHTLLFSGTGDIMSYYAGRWQRNLANPEEYTLIGPMVGPSPGTTAVLLTQPGAPYNTFEELIDYIKANPNTLTAAVAQGRPNEIRLRNLFEEFGVEEMVRWVSATNTETINGLLGGHMHLGMIDEGTAVQFLEVGDMKGLVIARTDRDYPAEDAVYLDSIPILPDVTQNYARIAVWWPMIIAGPPGMSDELAAYINDTTAKILESPEWMARIESIAGDSVYLEIELDEFREVMALADSQIEDLMRK